MITFRNNILSCLYPTVVASDLGVLKNITHFHKKFGSGALSDKMLLVRIIENNKIDAYFMSG